MSNIILFDGPNAKLPAYMANKLALVGINRDVVSNAALYPVLSLKGRQWTLKKDRESKVLMKDDGSGDTVQSVMLTVIRANTKAREYYAKAYNEAESEGAPPTCFSNNGIEPSAAAAEPQSRKCQLCAHAVWGGGVEGKTGTACSPKARLAVTDPENFTPTLLRLPPTSKKPFSDAVKAAETRGIPYNALVFRVGFETAPSGSPVISYPKLTFKLAGLLDDVTYARVSGAYTSEVVADIVGADELSASTADDIPATAVSAEELDAAIEAKVAVAQARVAKPAALPPAVKPPPPEPVEVAEVKPAKKVSKPAAAGGMDDLLGDLDALLGQTDD